MKLWPFFTFYGGKWRAAPRYPQPEFDTIIEPFAGAAGYSVRHYSKNVILVEKDTVIASLWRYLIKATKTDILNLPLLSMEQNVDDLDISLEAKTLIGFWLNKATASPCKTPGAWMRQGLRPKSFWGAEIRNRIAEQVEYINHWEVIQGDFKESPDMMATWFIDPPYANAGKLYKCSSKNLDYNDLSTWCSLRRGQVLVCENDGADWLPFKPFLTIKSTEGSHGKAKSKESLWVAHN